MVIVVKKLYVIGIWCKGENISGYRVIDIESTRNIITGQTLNFMDITTDTLNAALDINGIINMRKNKKGVPVSINGVIDGYPIVTGLKNVIVIIGKRNSDTIDYVTWDGIVKTIGIVELYQMMKSDRVKIANATVYVKNNKYILKGTGWKIKDDLCMAEIFADKKR